MKASKIHEILRNKQKVDIFYNERPVWIQEVNNDIAKIGFIDNFEEQLIGHHPGDSVDVTVTFPEDYGKDELNGKEALFKVTVNGIYK